MHKSENWFFIRFSTILCASFMKMEAILRGEGGGRDFCISLLGTVPAFMNCIPTFGHCWICHCYLMQINILTFEEHVSARHCNPYKPTHFQRYFDEDGSLSFTKFLLEIVNLIWGWNDNWYDREYRKPWYHFW